MDTSVGCAQRTSSLILSPRLLPVKIRTAAEKKIHSSHGSSTRMVFNMDFPIFKISHNYFVLPLVVLLFAIF